jgi:8-hydroxy-5-deazaflavin:NADPH oxidoreductase
MQIGIVGSGHIGGTVGRLLARAGHEVMLSSRHPEALGEVAAAAGPRAGTGGIEDAAAFGEVVVLAVPGDATVDTARGLGALDGKVVVDATNQYGQAASTPRLAKALPRSAVVKAFNTLQAALLGQVDQRNGDDRLVLFTCGNQADARATVDGLIDAAGGVPHDLGDLDQAPLMSPGGPLYNREVTAGTLVAVLDGLDERRPAVAANGAENPDQALEWLAKSVFAAGFRWNLVEAKWPALRTAFHDFQLQAVAGMTPEDVDRIATDPRVIRNRRKIDAVVANARTLTDVIRERGSVGAYLASFPDEDAAASDVGRRFHWIGPTTAHWFVHSCSGDQ